MSRIMLLLISKRNSS